MSDFPRDKKRIEALIKGRQFEEALESCNALLEKEAGVSAKILRLRAFAYASAGRFDAAIADRERIVETSEVLLRDYFQLGDNSISAGRFPEAVKWFTKTLQLGREQKVSWFEAATLLLLAYAQTYTGAIAEARENLESAVKIEPDCMMPLAGGDWATYQSIGEKIDRLVRVSEKPKH